MVHTYQFDISGFYRGVYKVEATTEEEARKIVESHSKAGRQWDGEFIEGDSRARYFGWTGTQLDSIYCTYIDGEATGE